MSETGKHGPKPQDQDVKFSRVAQTQAASPACVLPEQNVPAIKSQPSESCTAP